LTRIDGGRNHSFVLRARTTIGRNPDNDLSLTMGSVSRHHAVLIPAFRSALLQDLGSTNGVLVNKRRVRCARLEHGDVITLGEAQFRYTVAPVTMGAISPSQAPPRRRANKSRRNADSRRPTKIGLSDDLPREKSTGAFPSLPSSTGPTKRERPAQ